MALGSTIMTSLGGKPYAEFRNLVQKFFAPGAQNISGGEVVDLAGSDNLTLVKSNCVHFDGTDDVGTVAAVPAIDAYPLIMKARVYIDTLKDYNFIYHQAGTGGMALCVSNSGNVVCFVNNGALSYASSGTIGAGAWHEVEIRVTSSTDIEFYIDGAASGTATYTRTAPSGNYTQYIACFSGTAHYFNGKMCDLQVTAGGDKVLHLPMAEGAFSTLFDISGNNSHAILSNVTLPTIWDTTQDNYHHNITQGFNQIGYFGGTDEFVSMGDILDAPAAFTMCAWIITEGGKTQSVMGRYNGGDLGFQLWTSAGGDAIATIQTTEGNVVGTTNVDDGVPHHVAATYDGTDLKIYIDGAEENTAARTAPASTSLDYEIGRFAANNARCFGGAMWDARHYSTALSAGNIKKVMSDTYTATTPEFQLMLDDGVGTTAQDNTANNNDGTVTGATSAEFWAMKYPIYNLTVDAFIVVGQSNAEGRGTTASTENAPVGTAFELSPTAILPLADPVGGSATGSAWPSFAKDWQANTGANVAIIEVATGDSSVADNSNTAKSWTRGGDLYDAAITHIRSAINFANMRGITVNLYAIEYSQGERDANELFAGDITLNQYKVGLLDLIDRFREDIGDIPVVISRTGRLTSGVAEAEYIAIGDIQTELSQEYDYIHMGFTGARDFVDGVGNAKMRDTVHYETSGLDEMGNALSAYTRSIRATINQITYRGFARNMAGAWHNNAETLVKQKNLGAPDTNSFWYTSGSTRNEKAFSDFVENVNSDDKLFANVTHPRRVSDILGYSTALTGSDLTKVENFVSK